MNTMVWLVLFIMTVAAVYLIVGMVLLAIKLRDTWPEEGP
jgi:hypothetical protein